MQVKKTWLVAGKKGEARSGKNCLHQIKDGLKKETKVFAFDCGLIVCYLRGLLF